MNIFIFRISTKHISKAFDKYKSQKNVDEPSVLQRILAMDNDLKMATILALDLFLVGIDTVCFCSDFFLLKHAK